MARTLTAGATTAKAGPSYNIDWLVEAAAVSIRYSYTFEGPPGTWSHRLLAIREVETAIPPGGGIASISSLEVDVVEDRTGQSPLATWNTFEQLDGVAMTLKLLFAGEAYADAISVFSGVIDHVSWSNGIATISAVDKTLQKDLLLPTTIVTSEGFAGAPVDSINRPLAIVYGSGHASFGVPVLPTLLVKYPLANEYRVAGHAFLSYAAAAGPPVTLWPPGMQSAPPTNIIADGIPGDGTVTLASSILGFQWAISTAAQTTTRNSGVTGAFTLHTSEALNADGDGEAVLGRRGTLTEPEGRNTFRFYLLNHRANANSDATTVAKAFVNALDAGAAVRTSAVFQTETFRKRTAPRTDQFDVPLALRNGESPEVILIAVNEGAIGTVSDTYTLNGMIFEHYYQPADPLETLFVMASTGTLTGWKARFDASGGITGTSNAVIHVPADVLRSTLTWDLGLSADATTFVSARNTLSLARFDGGIGAHWRQERLNGREVLDQMTQQGRMYLLPAGDGTFKCRAYDSAAPTQFAFSVGNILTQAPEAAEFQHRSTLTVEMSRPELIHNNFKILYGWHPGLQRFGQQAFASISGSNHSVAATVTSLTNLCIDSQARYGDLPPLEMACDWIYNPQTANALLDHLVRYFWSQHLLVTFETTLMGVHLEVGDFITIAHQDLPENDTGQLFEIVRLTYIPSTARIRLQAMRVATQTVS